MPDDTSSEHYTERLRSRSDVWWKRLLNVQAPYRWNLRRLEPGFTLDVGCGIGRNLAHLDGHGIGVDHNPSAVAEARRRGATAFTTDEFDRESHARPFDSMLLAHLIEHMSHADAVGVVTKYLPLVMLGGKVIFICPQEAGYRSDSTHIEFVDFDAIGRVCRETGLTIEKQYSFPLPRVAGKLFRYNEFVVLARKSSG